jgi:multidrug resistance efflux pump
MNAPQAAPDPLAARLADLRRGRTLPDFHARLLELARDLTLAEAGAVLAESDGTWQSVAPAAGPEVPQDWARVAMAARAACGVAAQEAGPGRWLMAVPVDTVHVLAVQVPAAGPVDRALTRERLAMLAALADSAAATSGLLKLAPAAAGADALAALLAAPDRAAGLRDAAARLAPLLPAGTQLALGLTRGGRVAPIAFADQPLVVATPLSRALALLMEEALDRGAPIALPAADQVSAAGRAWPEALAGQALLAVPAASGGAAAVVLWHDQPPRAPDQVAGLLAPGLDLLGRLGAARPRPERRRRAAGRLAFVAAIAALVGAAGLLPRDDEVVASFVVQPARVHSVTAPFDGLLEVSDIRPGDTVSEGQVLARLATRELALEVAAVRARAANDRREAAIARANGQPAQELIAELSARRAEAQLALLEYRIGLAEIRAPAAGTVLAGDLRRSLGQALSRGQTLFEIEPGAGLHAEILLPETRAHLVRLGQPGLLAPAADPSARYAITIERVRPMAEIAQGRNVFRAIAVFASDRPDMLRPGAEGVARVTVGETTWLNWIFRDAVLAVRRWLWV